MRTLETLQVYSAVSGLWDGARCCVCLNVCVSPIYTFRIHMALITQGSLFLSLSLSCSLIQVEGQLLTDCVYTEFLRERDSLYSSPLYLMICYKKWSGLQAEKVVSECMCVKMCVCLSST